MGSPNLLLGDSIRCRGLLSNLAETFGFGDAKYPIHGVIYSRAGTQIDHGHSNRIRRHATADAIHGQGFALATQIIWLDVFSSGGISRDTGKRRSRGAATVYFDH